MQRQILITGATSGIGLATCHKFIENNPQDAFSFLLVGRRMERLAGVKQSLQDRANVHIHPLDVRDRQAVETFCEQYSDWLRKIDVLVNNAGLAAGIETADQANLDDWEQMIDTNIKGVGYMTRLVLPFMLERKEGHIVTIGSISGTHVYPGASMYCASKAAVHLFHEGVRRETVGKGIRTTLIAPGMVNTEFSVVRFKGDQERADSVYENIQPLTGEDVAEAIVWATNQPKHVNIQELLIMPTNQASPFHVLRENA